MINNLLKDVNPIIDKQINEHSKAKAPVAQECHDDEKVCWHKNVNIIVNIDSYTFRLLNLL